MAGLGRWRVLAVVAAVLLVAGACVPPAPTGQSPMPIGSTIELPRLTAGAKSTWSLEASAGEVLRFFLEGEGGSCPRLSVVGPAGAISELGGCGPLRIEFEQTGEYSVEVEGTDSDLPSGTTYLTVSRDASGGEIVPDSPLSAPSLLPGQAATFTLTSTGFDVFDSVATSIDTSVSVELRDPYGGVIGQVNGVGGVAYLPATHLEPGEHTLSVVNESGAALAAGEISTTLRNDTAVEQIEPGTDYDIPALGAGRSARFAASVAGLSTLRLSTSPGDCFHLTVTRWSDTVINGQQVCGSYATDLDDDPSDGTADLVTVDVIAVKPTGPGTISLTPASAVIVSPDSNSQVLPEIAPGEHASVYFEGMGSEPHIVSVGPLVDACLDVVGSTGEFRSGCDGETVSVLVPSDLGQVAKVSISNRGDVAAVGVPLEIQAGTLTGSASGGALLGMPSQAEQLTPPSLTSAAQACSDVLIVGARGADGKSDFNGFGADVSLIKAQLREKRRDLSFAQQAILVNPAPGPTPTQVTPFLQDLELEVTSAKVYLRVRATVCPNEEIVLIGYSRGAMALHRAVIDLLFGGVNDSAILDRVAGVILVGDGDRIRHDRTTNYGTAGDGGQGIANSALALQVEVNDTRRVKVPLDLGRRVHSICKKGDIICDHALSNWPGGIDKHQSYDWDDYDGATSAVSIELYNRRLRKNPECFFRASPFGGSISGRRVAPLGTRGNFEIALNTSPTCSGRLFLKGTAFRFAGSAQWAGVICRQMGHRNAATHPSTEIPLPTPNDWWVCLNLLGPA